MNNRLDHQLQNSVGSEIESLEQDLGELKSRQSIGRELVKRSYLVQTASTFDLSAYSIPANTTKFFSLQLTGDNTQAWPYGIQYSQIYNNGTDAAHRLSDYNINDSTGVSYFWFPNTGIRSVNTMAWTIGVVTQATPASIYMKFRAQLSCKATVLNLIY
ncbi:hypothetical protein QFZ60_001602 [Arthrobacter sp. B2I5]|uniref:hypothetical protein n=1 Tax=Arthrobacter sp. B2I5 TaxID=3042266 RepID=UPI0027846DF1|nr:hypothetical protein [Arthrobacter sp. B2I5]MDQ0825429.1 hypothetical protein [Arthrobacter sp. B2I5]